MTQLIADMGSCHENKLGYCEEMIEVCAPKKIWVKFQLCKPAKGNIPLNPEWLRMLYTIGQRRGTEVFASVWDAAGLKTVIEAGCRHVKFAYSARHLLDLQRDAINAGLQVYVTHSLLERPTPTTNIHRLWTVTDTSGAVYPTTSQILHNGASTRWDGFSCHSYDHAEVKRAVDADYKYVEFHAKLHQQTTDETIHDFGFALDIGSVLNYTNVNVGGK
jgi:hypothetical protein